MGILGTGGGFFTGEESQEAKNLKKAREEVWSSRDTSFSERDRAVSVEQNIQSMATSLKSIIYEINTAPTNTVFNANVEELLGVSQEIINQANIVREAAQNARNAANKASSKTSEYNLVEIEANVAQEAANKAQQAAQRATQIKINAEQLKAKAEKLSLVIEEKEKEQQLKEAEEIAQRTAKEVYSQQIKQEQEEELQGLDEKVIGYTDLVAQISNAQVFVQQINSIKLKNEISSLSITKTPVENEINSLLATKTTLENEISNLSTNKRTVERNIDSFENYNTMKDKVLNDEESLLNRKSTIESEVGELLQSKNSLESFMDFNLGCKEPVEEQIRVLLIKKSNIENELNDLLNYKINPDLDDRTKMDIEIIELNNNLKEALDAINEFKELTSSSQLEQTSKNLNEEQVENSIISQQLVRLSSVLVNAFNYTFDSYSFLDPMNPRNFFDNIGNKKNVDFKFYQIWGDIYDTPLKKLNFIIEDFNKIVDEGESKLSFLYFDEDLDATFSFEFGNEDEFDNFIEETTKLAEFLENAGATEDTTLNDIAENKNDSYDINEMDDEFKEKLLEGGKEAFPNLNDDLLNLNNENEEYLKLQNLYDELSSALNEKKEVYIERFGEDSLLQQKQAELDLINSSIEQQQSNLDSIDSLIQRKQNELDAINESLREKQSELFLTSVLLEQNQDNLDSINELIQEEKNKLDSISTEMQEKQNSLNSIISSLQEKQIQLDSINAEIQKKQTQVDSINAALGENQNEIDSDNVLLQEKKLEYITNKRKILELFEANFSSINDNYMRDIFSNKIAENEAQATRDSILNKVKANAFDMANSSIELTEEMLSFLTKGNNDSSIDNSDENSGGFLSEILNKVQSSLKEEQRIKDFEEYINSIENTITESQEQLANELANAIFDMTDFSELTEEELLEMEHLTGRERVGLAGHIFNFASASQQLSIQAGKSGEKIKVAGLLSKWIKDPVSAASMGNIIYKSIKDFEDGATTQEVFAFLYQGSKSVAAWGNIVKAFAAAKKTAVDEGVSLGKALIKEYTTGNKISTKYMYTYDFSSQTLKKGIFKESAIKSELTSLFTDGTYKSPSTSEGVGSIKPPKSSSSVSSASDIAKKTDGVAAKLSLVADIAWVASSIAEMCDGEEVTASEILNCVGSVIAVTGDVISLAGGPIGQVVGMVVSAVGGIVSTLGVFTELDSNSSPQEIGTAVGDFLTAFNPLFPSMTSINTAVEYQNLKNSADNEIDRMIYGTLHKIASLDCSPIVNLFHFIYDPVSVSQLKGELMDKFGTFDNMMKEYILNDSDFTNSLSATSRFLKENANTTHTQFITGYLTPEQISEFFKKDASYSGSYDVLNIDENIIYPGELDGHAFLLEKNEGTHVYPNTLSQQKIDKFESHKFIDHRSGSQQGLDRLYYINPRNSDAVFSLGYGEGREIENARKIDTATKVQYNKSQLEQYKNYLKEVGFLKPGAKEDPHGYYWPEDFYHHNNIWFLLRDDVSATNLKFERDSEIFKPMVNNRIIVTISDILSMETDTRGGDDDVIVSDLIRVYDDQKSVVRTLFDGGEGEDVLDLSHIQDLDLVDFNLNYSIKYNTFYVEKLDGNGKDFEMYFKNFEEIRLSNKKNTITLTEGELDDGEENGQIRLIGLGAISNNIDLSNVTKKSLYFEGSLDSVNNISGTENGDVINVHKLNDDEFEGGSFRAYGNGGNDVIIGGNFSSKNYMKGQNILYGGDGDDYITCSGEYSEAYGESGIDIILGSNRGISKLYGGDNNDVLNAGKGSAILDGGNGNDFITGNIGEDTISGGTGDDILTGGDGADTFVFSHKFGKDTINDYQSNDTIIFDNDSGIEDIAELLFIKNDEENSLALLHGSDCIKIKGWNSRINLNVKIGDETVLDIRVVNLIMNSIDINDYKEAMVGKIENSINQMAGMELVSYSSDSLYNNINE